jgi:hypothetical protein
MAECREIGLMLDAAADGELEPDDMQQVTHHLVGCAACTGELSDYSTIGGELRAIVVVPSLEKFTSSVLDLIQKLVIVAIFAVALYGITARPKTTEIARTWPDAAASRRPSSVTAPTRKLDVHVDSVFVADANEGIERRHVPTSGSVDHRTEFGKMTTFRLAGGKILHVRPRALDGDMIAMQVVLFDGKRTTMTIDLNLQNGGTFALAGEQYEEGTLLIRISPSAVPIASSGSSLL